ncbi:MAG TPA: DUF4870 domain-containing protein [Candidatus Omnitrophota bacterium]|nr:DUF4870 domain-containing protein [Candidatus Omnitrophota bacterium]
MAENQGQDLGTTDTGIKPNIAALLAYLLGFISGLVFLLIEKKNKFVRFHAMQSIVVFGAIFVAQWVLTLIPVLGILASGLLSIFGVGLWIVLMVKAYQGDKFKLPWAGEIAEKNS